MRSTDARNFRAHAAGQEQFFTCRLVCGAGPFELPRMHDLSSVVQDHAESDEVLIELHADGSEPGKKQLRGFANQLSVADQACRGTELDEERTGIGDRRGTQWHSAFIRPTHGAFSRDYW